MRVVDITGRQFNSWTVLGRAESDSRGRARWLAVCDCGTEKVVDGYSLRKGTSPSCGCRTRQRVGAANHLHRHGMSRSPEWRSWNGMLSRCYGTGNPKFPDYGGRGITVHPSWRHSFEQFYADMGPRPAGTSLDRINNDGNYEPGNCRWATPKVQSNNRRPPRRRKTAGDADSSAGRSTTPSS